MKHTDFKIAAVSLSIIIVCSIGMTILDYKSKSKNIKQTDISANIKQDNQIYFNKICEQNSCREYKLKNIAEIAKYDMKCASGIEKMEFIPFSSKHLPLTKENSRIENILYKISFNDGKHVIFEQGLNAARYSDWIPETGFFIIKNKDNYTAHSGNKIENANMDSFYRAIRITIEDACYEKKKIDDMLESKKLWLQNKI